ncbi:uncharacterized protein Pyn_32763 [Prunus yedoensis var. nudiflora]|uniref:Zinc knuckle CX2CX4HX4C domain-containing protein n=1 Tax=Prunus yedoensis var. nudiflora TaxID=2094558 RepID=A0A314UDD6_PRUYE|nr:uncharacterized protein Pyn_32763 [Prunus yedoensis var. nudiflora]
MEPWSFKRMLILLRRVDGASPVCEITLNTTDFWIQVHNLPILSMTASVARLIGNRLGSFLEVAQGDDGDCIIRCLRIRVRVDVTKPLWRGMNISFSGIGSKWVDFTYERLPEFCNDCGSLEHWTPDCSRPSMDIRVGVMKPFSSSLHASLEPFGGPRFSDRRARDRSITFSELAGPSCDEDRRWHNPSSAVVLQSPEHNLAVGSGYLDLSPSIQEISQLHGFQKSEAVSPLPVGKLKAQVSMSHTSQLGLSGTVILYDPAQRVETSSPVIPTNLDTSTTSVSPLTSGLSSISYKGWKRSARLKGVADTTLPLTDVTNSIPLLGGYPDDFNQGSLQIKCPKKIKFRDVLVDCGLSSIPFVGHSFTWSNYRAGDDFVEERLDRGLVNDTFLLDYPHVLCHHLDNSISEHKALLFDVFTDNEFTAQQS